MKRGEVYWANLAPRSGSEQTGKRPVIIVSNDGFNQAAAWQSLIVVPITTSSTQARRGPTVVEIRVGLAGLSRNSVAICHQITTLDRAKLTKRIGALSPDLVDSLADALKVALDLD